MPPSLGLKNIYFFRTDCVYLRFSYKPQKTTTIISLYSSNWFIRITEAECDYCGVGTESRKFNWRVFLSPPSNTILVFGETYLPNPFVPHFNNSPALGFSVFVITVIPRTHILCHACCSNTDFVPYCLLTYIISFLNWFAIPTIF
jgi:hypothetical protein